MTRSHYEKLKTFCQQKGAALFGVADISGVKKDFNLNSEEIYGLDKAISIGFLLSRKVLDGIKDHPTKLYYQHYKQVNAFLDRLALEVVNLLQQDGYLGLAIPASHIIDWEKQTAHVSHKKIAQLAGLGWLGRNNLLVNKDFGAQFRLVTILTDAPLAETYAVGATRRVAPTCNNCRACISACPAGAIKENSEDFDHIACYEKLREFRKLGYTDQFICGTCVKACRGKTRL
jgi:epoxyqueuosine reductase QueG